MRIALISLHTSPLAQPGQGDAGGMNVYVRAVAEHFAREGHHVDVYTREDGSTYSEWEKPQTPRLITLPVGPAITLSKEQVADLIPRFAEKLASHFDAEKYDVVHSHYWISGAAVFQALSRTASATPTLPRFFHTMHTIAAVKNNSHPANSEHHQRLEAENQVAQGCDALIVNTEIEAKELQQFYNVPESQTHVIHPGVNLGLFTPAGHIHTWSTDSRFKIMFAGRIQPLKGPQVLIEALQLWKQDITDDEFPVSVVIAGEISGNHNLDLPARAQQAGLTDHINFLGALPVTKLVSMFRAADVVVVPSYSESFGLVALEAQSCGTPVIAHKVGGLTLAVADGVSGQLVGNLEPETWKQVLQYWQQNPEVVQDYASCARFHAEKFSWKETTKNLLRTYRRYLN